MMNTQPPRRSLLSPRHSGCHIRNKPSSVSNNECRQMLCGPTQSTRCNTTSMAKESQRPECVNFLMASVGISSISSELRHLEGSRGSLTHLTLIRTRRGLAHTQPAHHWAKFNAGGLGGDVSQVNSQQSMIKRMI